MPAGARRNAASSCAPHHQRLAEHELIVHDDPGRHEHEPPPRQLVPARPRPARPADARARCTMPPSTQRRSASSNGPAITAAAHTSHVSTDGHEVGQRWAQQVALLVAVRGCLHEGAPQLGAERDQCRHGGDGDERRPPRASSAPANAAATETGTASGTIARVAVRLTTAGTAIAATPSEPQRRRPRRVPHRGPLGPSGERGVERRGREHAATADPADAEQPRHRRVAHALDVDRPGTGDSLPDRHARTTCVRRRPMESSCRTSEVSR